MNSNTVFYNSLLASAPVRLLFIFSLFTFMTNFASAQDSCVDPEENNLSINNVTLTNHYIECHNESDKPWKLVFIDDFLGCELDKSKWDTKRDWPKPADRILSYDATEQNPDNTYIGSYCGDNNEWIFDPAIKKDENVTVQNGYVSLG